jgi:uncharacterized phiE125 gp8 family phage protein
MMLTEQTAVPTAALPIQEFKDHLRLGTGFADDGVQDALAEGYLRAAMAAIEGRIGKALMSRDFLWLLDCWRDGMAQAVPVAPVSAVASLTVRDAGGVATAVPAAAWRLVKDMHRPKIAGVGGSLPAIPTGGQAEILFTAGFGPAWSNVPVDLAQAVFLLAAQFHENRHEPGERGAGLPFGVMALIERWRTVRVLGGGEA